MEQTSVGATLILICLVIIGVSIYAEAHKSSGGGGGVTIPSVTVGDPLPEVVNETSDFGVVTNHDYDATYHSYESQVIYVQPALDRVYDWFKSRYSATTLRKPIISYEAPVYNNTMSYYDPLDSKLHISPSSIWRQIDSHSWSFGTPETINFTVSHEFCHYVMDKYCSFPNAPDWEESFCQVFANSHSTETKGKYNEPYRTFEVDRLAFLDCVFEKKCGVTGFVKIYIDGCYEKARI